LEVLNGIRVIDLTQALAGPYCAQLLGDFGAEVIKVERPAGGDQARGWGPPFVAGESSYFMGTNRNKRSITLDLQIPQAREIMDCLVDRADVLIHNVPRRATREKLGIDAARVRGRNRRIIWASITGFGLTGPEAEKPGYDVIAQAMSGTMALTGEPDHGPTRFPTPMADITTGIYTALAIVAALYERQSSGVGQELDLALLDCQTTWLANVASAYLATGSAPAKRGNAHPNIAPYQPFHAADDWFIVAAGTEGHWKSLIKTLGIDANIGGDSRFSSNAERVAHREELDTLLSEQFARHPVDYWIGKLEAAGIPCGPINRPEQILNHPHLAARNMIVSTQHPSAGPVRSLGNPIKMSRTTPRAERPAPLLGEQTEAVLYELGYVSDQIEQLRRVGAV